MARSFESAMKQYETKIVPALIDQIEVIIDEFLVRFVEGETVVIDLTKYFLNGRVGKAVITEVVARYNKAGWKANFTNNRHFIDGAGWDSYDVILNVFTEEEQVKYDKEMSLKQPLSEE